MEIPKKKQPLFKEAVAAKEPKKLFKAIGPPDVTLIRPQNYSYPDAQYEAMGRNISFSPDQVLVYNNTLENYRIEVLLTEGVITNFFLVPIEPRAKVKTSGKPKKSRKKQTSPPKISPQKPKISTKKVKNIGGGSAKGKPPSKASLAKKKAKTAKSPSRDATMKAKKPAVKKAPPKSSKKPRKK